MEGIQEAYPDTIPIHPGGSQIKMQRNIVPICSDQSLPGINPCLFKGTDWQVRVLATVEAFWSFYCVAFSPFRIVRHSISVIFYIAMIEHGPIVLVCLRLNRTIFSLLV